MDQIKPFIHDLKSDDPAIRESAAKSLYYLGVSARPALLALFDALLAAPASCPWVGATINAIGPRPADLQALQAGLRHPNRHVKFWATRALVKLGPDATPVIPDLILLLKDVHHPVVDSAIWALDSIGEAAIAPLCAAAIDADRSLRQIAVVALGKSAKHIEEKLPIVIKALDDSDPAIRPFAVRSICGLAEDIMRKKRTDTLTTVELQAASNIRKALQRIDSDPSLKDDSNWMNCLIRRFDEL